MPNPVIIDDDTCNGCRICYNDFGCPAIGVKSSGKAFILNDLCNGNGSCIQVCPVQAIQRPQPVPPTARGASDKTKGTG